MDPARITRAAAREAGAIPEFAHGRRTIEQDLSLDHGLVHSSVVSGGGAVRP